MLQTEALMVLALGFVLALIAAMLLSRTIWNVAQRISRRRQEKARPDEIRDLTAERDQLRASQAMLSRKHLTQIESLKADVVAHEAEVSRHRNRIQSMIAETNEHRASVNELDTRVKELNLHIDAIEIEARERGQQIVKLSEELTSKNNELVQAKGDIADREAEVARLTRELANMSSLFDKSNAQLRQIESDLDSAMSKSDEVSRRHMEAVRQLAAERERSTAILAQAEYAQNYSQPAEPQLQQSVRQKARPAPTHTQNPTGGSADMLLTPPATGRFNFEGAASEHPETDVSRMMQAARRAMQESQNQINIEKTKRPAVANVVAIAQRLRAQKDE